MTGGARACAWIERTNQLGDRHVDVVRVLYGLFFLLANAPVLIGLGYDDALAGAYFRVPLVPALAGMPPPVHAALVYSLVPLASLFTAGVAVRTVSLATSAILLYLLLFDYFGFRHIWFLHANAFFLWAWIGGRGDVGRRTRPYGIAGYRAIVCCVYWCAAVAKMNAGFLGGHAVASMTAQQWGTGSAVFEILSAQGWVWPAAAWIGLAGEVLIPVLLLAPPTRTLAYVVGGAFHIGVVAVTLQGPSLHIMMLLSYLLFARSPRDPIPIEYRPASRLHRWLPRLDWLERFDWRPGSRLAAGDRPRATLALLVTHIPLLNPIFAAWLGAGVLFSCYVAVTYFA